MDKKERDAVERDRILFGTGIAVDGKRIDPATVTISPAAPAPASLAGGEVERASLEKIRDQFDLLVRLACGGSVFEVDRSTGKRIRRKLSEVVASEADEGSKFVRSILAALSPEAPAREGAARDRLIEVLKRMDDGVYASLNDQADAIISALTPRHEAPASEDEARRKLIECIDQWDSEMEYDAEDRVCLADDILHAFNGPPVVSHEAPAEGAGERTKGAAELQAELDQLANEYGDLLAEVEALRARSSAPEAREGEAVGYANAEFMRRLKNWRDGVPNSLRADETFLKAVSSESYPVALYTHPAAPSADKLRIAVEAIDRAVVVRAFCASDPLSYRLEFANADDRFAAAEAIDQALAALKAEAK